MVHLLPQTGAITATEIYLLEVLGMDTVSADEEQILQRGT